MLEGSEVAFWVSSTFPEGILTRVAFGFRSCISALLADEQELFTQAGASQAAAKMLAANPASKMGSVLCINLTIG